jgi:hypothetical protein
MIASWRGNLTILKDTNGYTKGAIKSNTQTLLLNFAINHVSLLANLPIIPLNYSWANLPKTLVP